MNDTLMLWSERSKGELVRRGLFVSGRCFTGGMELCGACGAGVGAELEGKRRNCVLRAACSIFFLRLILSPSFGVCCFYCSVLCLFDCEVAPFYLLAETRLLMLW